LSIPPGGEQRLREIVREEIASSRILDHEDTVRTMLWANDARKAEAERSEKRRTSLAGLGWGIAGTLGTTVLGWITGAVPWLIERLGSGHK